MRRTYLYKLYRHSFPGFLLVCLLLVCYALTFSKKMDMVLFPYNSMYAIDHHAADTISTFAVKINGEKIRITNRLYWKKDFLETSLNGYCRYIKHGNRVFLDDYLEQKIPNRNTRNKFLDKLAPKEGTEQEWPLWYVAFAGYNKPLTGRLQIVEYTFLFNQNAVLVDSSLIQQIFLP